MSAARTEAARIVLDVTGVYQLVLTRAYGPLGCDFDYRTSRETQGGVVAREGLSVDGRSRGLNSLVVRAGPSESGQR